MFGLSSFWPLRRFGALNNTVAGRIQIFETFHPAASTRQARHIPRLYDTHWTVNSHDGRHGLDLTTPGSGD